MPQRDARSAPFGRVASGFDRVGVAVTYFGRGACLMAAVVQTACGGGLPLLHPATTLGAGEIRAAAGFGGNVAAFGLADAVREANRVATANPNSTSPTSPDPTFAKGALAFAVVGPGLFPFAAARVGLGDAFEGGLAYTGRAVRADFRRSFRLGPSAALSLGAGGSATLYGHGDSAELPNVDLGRLHGWGADVPVLVGYHSDADLYFAWVGARASWQHLDIGELTSQPQSPTFAMPPAALSATSLSAGAVAGLAVGFRHVHVAVEIDSAYASIVGDYGAAHASASGLTLAPAAALWWRF
jgi:hypothetical protein